MNTKHNPPGQSYLKKIKAKLWSKVFREPQKIALDTGVPFYLGECGEASLLFRIPFPFPPGLTGRFHFPEHLPAWIPQ